MVRIVRLPNAIHHQNDSASIQNMGSDAKSRGQCSLSYQAPFIWNQLPVSVRHPTSVSSFKSFLKNILILKPFSSAPFAPRYECVRARARVCVWYALNFANMYI